MKMLRNFLTHGVAGVLTLVMAVSIAAVPAYAQTPSPTSNLNTLRERYRTELSIYRTDERAFDLAKEQYAKLGTLTSLEVAVKATQKVMLSRADVLVTYMQMLSEIIGETPGIDINQKNGVITDLEALEERLLQHKELTKLAVDRIQLAKAAQDFDTFGPSVSRMSYKTLSYIAYGQMQSVHDKTISIGSEITTYVEAEEKNSLKLAEKRRALEEIERGFGAITERLAKVLEKINVDKKNEARFNQSSYNSTVEELGKVYADLFRVITSFREVERT